MRRDHDHVSDLDLIRAADGEVSTREGARIAAHLAACWTCRTRMKELEEAVADFVTAHRDGPESTLPPADGPRARLRARLRERAGERPPWSFGLSGLRFGSGRLYVALGSLALIALLWLLAWDLRRGPFYGTGDEAYLLRPDPGLTLGATVGLDADDVCGPAGPEPGQQLVPATVARNVFAVYGIRDADERAYELDYLIPPELGGSDDRRNLWPQAYATPVWNAHVKDALEAHLYRLVCSGQISLAAAQMDIAADWIAAYKKHFEREFPVSDHLAFLKDEPWED